MNKRILLACLCFLVAAGALTASLLMLYRQRQLEQLETQVVTVSKRPLTSADEEDDTEDEAVDETDSTEALPAGKLLITADRKAYESGSMQLIIPSIEVDEPVLGDTSDATLKKGLGLYDYAQMPFEEGGNVSIAGHRNGTRNGVYTLDWPFYPLDQLGEGDLFYLIYDGVIYQYLWDQTIVVEQDDWSVIYSQGFSCLTLTTCTPIGVADHRLIVRARLIDSFEVDDSYDYPAVWEEEDRTPSTQDVNITISALEEAHEHLHP